MRVPLLALLPIALCTFASLANAHFTDNVGTREIHARSFHHSLALHQRDILASLSTRELIDALSEQLERRGAVGLWLCHKCNTHWDASQPGKLLQHPTPRHDIQHFDDLWYCHGCELSLQILPPMLVACEHPPDIAGPEPRAYTYQGMSLLCFIAMPF
ncbi:hypothetical protein DFP72DRAFT_855427 [Ephemerocybe angulata]|uniref:C2H2-type domain-containing protein n=1 Tax=Ephemerocybe angulata TaxID=980116 RepID=A0A8H6HIJ0_9AGAR|nr:hypothetical protein DFP72DRAFT_855427 [Tulosesus angulatus]